MRLVLMGTLLVLAGASGAVAAEPPLVLLDPGHTAAHPGATSIRGTPEVEYNDAFVALLAPRLRAAGFRVEPTRRPGEELDVDARAARTGADVWLLLSIHHDSAQEQFLAREERDGKDAFRATRPIRGYSIFVSGWNARYLRSVEVARALGRELAALGRSPTLHHAEPIAGEGRPFLDRTLGIYRFDELRLLRLASCPAVLVELGVLVDPVDERYVSDPIHQAAMADAIVRALVEARDGQR